MVRERLTYLAPRKLIRIQQTLRQIDRRGVEGDLLEFGVALGGSAILIARHAGNDRRFYGLDVFGMIPPPTSEKDDEKSRTRYEIISSGKSRGIKGDRYYGYREDLLDEVTSNLARHGVAPDGSKVHLVRGLFEDTWPTLAVERVSFAHLDCDWYDPVKYCLEAIGDKVSMGGAIVIDDYHDYGGCRTAVDEFLTARSDFAIEPGPNPILRKIG